LPLSFCNAILSFKTFNSKGERFTGVWLLDPPPLTGVVPVVKSGLAFLIMSCEYSVNNFWYKL